jgi:hypothetical protein
MSTRCRLLQILLIYQSVSLSRGCGCLRNAGAGGQKPRTRARHRVRQPDPGADNQTVEHSGAACPG